MATPGPAKISTREAMLLVGALTAGIAGALRLSGVTGSAMASAPIPRPAARTTTTVEEGRQPLLLTPRPEGAYEIIGERGLIRSLESRTPAPPPVAPVRIAERPPVLPPVVPEKVEAPKPMEMPAPVPPVEMSRPMPMPVVPVMPSPPPPPPEPEPVLKAVLQLEDGALALVDVVRGGKPEGEARLLRVGDELLGGKVVEIRAGVLVWERDGNRLSLGIDSKSGK